MHYLYILKSLKNNKHYIGITNNPKKRLAIHNAGAVRSTKAYRPWQQIHLEEYLDKKSARQREIFLKRTAKARKDLFLALTKPAAPSSNGQDIGFSSR